MVATGCGGSAADPGEGGGEGDTGKADDPTQGPASGSSSGGTGGSTGSAGSTDGTGAGDSGSTGFATTGTVDSSTVGSGSSTGALGACPKRVVLMGYWPPTNDMLRPWSTNPALNPDGWVGENWRGLGFDVYAFFPEFPPDGDPSNDPIGAPGSVGSEDSDLQVDYQDTSADFWRIVDELQPQIVITHSRGGGIGWEIEAVEGGHGMGAPSPALDWISDQYGDVTVPTEDTVDPRSWQAINDYRDVQANSLLPLEAVRDAVDALGLTSVAIDLTQTSGRYLSGFLGLHGIVYAEQTPHAVVGGHIHVGIPVPTEDARAMVETTLEVVLAEHPADTLDCAPRR